MANDPRIEIRIAHYPPDTSKYNPIEHRLFPHVSRACQGMIFERVQTVHDLIARTTTRIGLKVFTAILDQPYRMGRKGAKDCKATMSMSITFDDVLP